MFGSIWGEKDQFSQISLKRVEIDAKWDWATKVIVQSLICFILLNKGIWILQKRMFDMAKKSSYKKNQVSIVLQSFPICLRKREIFFFFKAVNRYKRICMVYLGRWRHKTKMFVCEWTKGVTTLDLLFLTFRVILLVLTAQLMQFFFTRELMHDV